MSTPVPHHKIRILVVDDHPMLRDGVAALIEGQEDMELVAQASTGAVGIEQFQTHLPDITLMDLQMPGGNGMDAIDAIRRFAPAARIIVLTTYSGDMQVVRALDAGAMAYLLKNTLHADLLNTIRSVHSGRKTVSPELATELAEHAGMESLTAREIEVLRLIAGGNANKEIAARLSITEETVKSRVKNILAKLNANDRTHAAIIGLRRGIIDL